MATAVGKSVERVAASDATATAQTLAATQARETAEAASTASALASAATATTEAQVAADSAATAAAEATTAAAATATPAPTTAAATAAPAPAAKATAAPAKPAQPGVVANFEGNATWQIGDQRYATFERSTEQAYEGSASGRLQYDFPAVADNFVVFRARPGIPLAGQPTGLSAWVYGDGSGNYLNAWLQDAAGQVRQYTFGQINHQGWQKMTAMFDDTLGWPNVRISGTDTGKLAFPASLWGIVLDGVPDGKASKGTVYLDAIQTVTQPGDTGGAPASPAENATPSAQGAAPAALSGKLAVAAYVGGRNTYDLFVGAASGDGLTRVLDYASQPELSANGALVAFRRWSDSDRGLAVMPAGGGAERRVTQYLEDSLPSWSPGGDRLVFASRRESDRKSRLYSVPSAGGGDSELRQGSDPIFGEFPTWMSNGNIVYKSNYPTQGLVVIGPDGSNPRPILNDGSATAPAETAKADRIAFMSQRDGNWEIYTIGRDGSGLARLTNSPSNDGLPAWSPDGGSLAFISDRGGSWGVWVMAADGSSQRKLFDLPGSADGRVGREPDYSSRGWTEERLSWSG